MSFNHSITQEKDNIVVISLSGRLIEKNQAIDLINEIDNLVNDDPLKLVIDLSELNYMNSSGLNILITLLTKARKTGGEAVLANEPEIIKKLLIITKLNQVFTVAENKEKALKHLRN